MPRDDFESELNHQHRHLRDLLAELGTLTRNPEGFEAAKASLVAKLRALREMVQAHFAFEEEGGYMSEVLRKAPRFLPEVERLEAQHTQILRDLDRLTRTDLDETDSDTFLAEVHGLIERLGRHEREETDVVQRSVIEDTGVGD